MVFIFVHIGAGKYSSNKIPKYKQLIEQCLTLGNDQFHKSKSLEDTALLIMTLLEESGTVNTGKGSNLTRDLTVECDAIAIRSHDGAHGCVTAVPDTIRPSAIAFSLLEESTLGLEMEQLIRPCLLTGSSALKYAKENGLFKDGSIKISQRKRGERYLEILEEEQKKRQETGDTVGCIVMENDHVVVASSSGGNWLKQPGRGGLCSVPGAGVWCEEGIGCVCSGYGECFMRSLFAKRCCDLRGTADQIAELMQNTLFKDMQRMKITLDPVFAVAFLDERQSVLHVVHSSIHFGFGYHTETTSQIEISEKTNTEQFQIHTIHIFHLC